MVTRRHEVSRDEASSFPHRSRLTVCASALIALCPLNTLLQPTQGFVVSAGEPTTNAKQTLEVLDSLRLLPPGPQSAAGGKVRALSADVPAAAPSEEPNFLRLLRQNKFAPFLNVLRKGTYDINVSSKRDGLTVLQLVVKADAPKVMQEILKVPSLDVNRVAECGEAALHTAVAMESRGVRASSRTPDLPPSPLDLLLARSDIDPNVRDSRGCTPLHRAIKGGHYGAFTKLLSSGPEIDLEIRDATPHQFSPLQLAIGEGRSLMVKDLLEHRALLNTTTADGQPPLHQALRRGDKLTVAAILEGIVSARRGQEPEQVPGHDESEEGHKQSASLGILDATNPINIKDKTGETPLDIALGSGWKQMVNALLKAGADPKLARSQILS